MFDFDVNSGIVSNPITIESGSNYYYGTEWSPDNTKIYFSRYISGTGAGLAQYDLATTSIHSFPGRTLGSLRLAPDDKIYAAPGSPAGTALSVVNNPNGLGAAANYVPDQQGGFSGGWILLGLPDNFLCSSVLTCKIDSVVQACTTDPTTQFTANVAGTWGGGAYINGTGVFDPSVAGVGTHWITFDGGCPEPDSVQMVVAFCCPNIDPNLGANTTICADKTISLDAGSGLATYEWKENGVVMPGQTGSIITADSGTYVVNVTDASGCTGSDTIEIGNTQLPIVNLGPDTSYCVGNCIQLDAGSFPSIVWTPYGEITQQICAGVDTTYAVVVTDANGCTATDDIDITQSALPIVNLGGTASYCVGDSVELDAGTGFVSYSWKPNNEGTSSIFAKTTGKYSVSVVNGNGCVGVDTVTVSEVSPLPVNLGADTFYCEFDSVRLDVQSGYSSYTWTPNISTTEVGYAKSAGSYSIVVTDASGCKGWDTVEITMSAIPVVNLGPDTFYCAADSFLLDAGNGFSNYAWTPNIGSGQTIFAKSQTNYSVIVTDANGCNGSDNVDITEKALPSVNIGPDTTICKADSFLLDATHPNGFSYLWTPNSKTNAIIKVGSSPTTYKVVVTDNNGCVFTTQRTVSEDVPPVVNLGSNDTICDNLTKTLEATPGYNYKWYLDGSVIADTTRTIDADSGTYVVAVTTTLGCESRDTITVYNYQLPIVSLASSFEFCKLDSVKLDAGNSTTTYSWAPTGDTTQTIWAKQGGQFTVTITDTNACVNSGTTSVIENSLPPVNLGANDSACIGLSITLDASVPNGVKYIWSDGHNQSTYTISNPDTLSVIVEDADGCIGYDTIEIKQLQQLSLQLSDTSSRCANDTLSLNAGNFSGADYLWNLPDGSTDNAQVISMSDSGWYVINVTDKYNCKGSDSIFGIIIPIPNIDLGPDTSFCSLGQDTYTIKMKFSELIPGVISWNEDNNSSNDTLFIATQAPSTIIGVFEDTLNCFHSDTVELTEFCEPTKILMPNVFVPGGTENPTFHPIGVDDNTYVDIVNNIVTSKFEVYNRWGVKMFQSVDLLPRWNGMYENRKAASGTYYWIYSYTDSSLKEYKLNGFVQLIQMR